jgi:hypothetical protein
LEHRVIAYSGCSYSNTPLEFFIGEERHVVSRVIATWLEESEGTEGMTRQVWRVADFDEGLYRLTYHRVLDFWEIEAQISGGSKERA